MNAQKPPASKGMPYVISVLDDTPIQLMFASELHNGPHFIHCMNAVNCKVHAHACNAGPEQRVAPSFDSWLIKIYCSAPHG